MRLDHGLTIRELAEVAGCHPNQIQRAESGGAGLGQEAWFTLADYFGMPAQILARPSAPERSQQTPEVELSGETLPAYRVFFAETAAAIEGRLNVLARQGYELRAAVAGQEKGASAETSVRTGVYVFVERSAPARQVPGADHQDPAERESSSGSQNSST
jgi:transcriptional regulator with XRE-family HTH domain